MRTIVSTTGLLMLFILLMTQANAQDAGNKAAGKQVSQGNDQADKKLDKKIQQQSLSGPFQQLDTVAAASRGNKKQGHKKRGH